MHKLQSGDPNYTYLPVIYAGDTNSYAGTNPDNYQSTTQGYCAWHDWNGDTTLNGGAVASNYGDIAFSNQPYNIDTGSNCGVGFVNSPGTTDRDASRRA